MEERGNENEIPNTITSKPDTSYFPVPCSIQFPPQYSDSRERERDTKGLGGQARTVVGTSDRVSQTCD
jgi:hypothetical protein